MPATSVAKISGAMIILIMRRNSWLKGRKYAPTRDGRTDDPSRHDADRKSDEDLG